MDSNSNNINNTRYSSLPWISVSLYLCWCVYGAVRAHISLIISLSKCLCLNFVYNNQQQQQQKDADTFPLASDWIRVSLIFRQQNLFVYLFMPDSCLFFIFSIPPLSLSFIWQIFIIIFHLWIEFFSVFCCCCCLVFFYRRIF